ncbi:MAG: hypothetical protein ACI4SM_01385 [Candidatus Gastranaerophilaceae bacterium]
MKNKTDLKPDKISYKKYYRLMAILGAVGGFMQIFYWAAEKFLPDFEKGNILSNVINLTVSLGTLAIIGICLSKMISVFMQRDKEDELVQQITARINQTFVSFLFTAACLFICITSFASNFLGSIKITLNFIVVTGIVWLCFSLYHFIGLYFESKFDDNDYEKENK